MTSITEKIDKYLNEEIKDSKGNSIQAGDLVYYSKAPKLMTNKAKVKKIDKNKISLTFWSKRKTGNKETFEFNKKQVEGYLTLEEK